jgi:hypothetical protein
MIAAKKITGKIMVIIPRRTGYIYQEKRKEKKNQLRDSHLLSLFTI